MDFYLAAEKVEDTEQNCDRTVTKRTICREI